MALTKLSSGKMLFAYARSDSSNLYYRVFDGSAWGTTQTVVSTGIITGYKMQISAASDSTGKPYLAYATKGTSGTLKVATWTNTGTSPTITTVDDDQSYSLPSLIVTSGDRVHIYTISNKKMYVLSEYRSGTNTVWFGPYRPYSEDKTVNQLTVSIPLDNQSTDAIWTEGTKTYVIKSGGFVPDFKIIAGCDHQAKPSNRCTGIHSSELYGYSTPKTAASIYNLHSCVGAPQCVDTDYELVYATIYTIDTLFGKKELYFRHGWHFMYSPPLLTTWEFTVAEWNFDEPNTVPATIPKVNIPTGYQMFQISALKYEGTVNLRIVFVLTEIPGYSSTL